MLNMLLLDFTVILTRARWGILTRRWGGGAFHPPAFCQTTGPILEPKRAFDSSGLELSENVAKLYLNVTDDVTVRINGLFFIICHCWHRRAKQPFQIEMKSMK